MKLVRRVIHYNRSNGGKIELGETIENPEQLYSQFEESKDINDFYPTKKIARPACNFIFSLKLSRLKRHHLRTQYLQPCVRKRTSKRYSLKTHLVYFP